MAKTKKKNNMPVEVKVKTGVDTEKMLTADIRERDRRWYANHGDELRAGINLVFGNPKTQTEWFNTSRSFLKKGRINTTRKSAWLDVLLKIVKCQGSPKGLEEVGLYREANPDNTGDLKVASEMAAISARKQCGREWLTKHEGEMQNGILQAFDVPATRKMWTNNYRTQVASGSIEVSEHDTWQRVLLKVVSHAGARKLYRKLTAKLESPEKENGNSRLVTPRHLRHLSTAPISEQVVVGTRPATEMFIHPTRSEIASWWLRNKAAIRVSLASFCSKEKSRKNMLTKLSMKLHSTDPDLVSCRPWQWVILDILLGEDRGRAKRWKTSQIDGRTDPSQPTLSALLSAFSRAISPVEEEHVAESTENELVRIESIENHPIGEAGNLQRPCLLENSGETSCPVLDDEAFGEAHWTPLRERILNTNKRDKTLALELLALVLEGKLPRDAHLRSEPYTGLWSWAFEAARSLLNPSEKREQARGTNEVSVTALEASHKRDRTAMEAEDDTMENVLELVHLKKIKSSRDFPDVEAQCIVTG